MIIPTKQNYEAIYQKLLASLADFLHDGSIVESHQDNLLLRLIASLPFIAGCEQPDRIALVHMSTYLLMSHPGFPKKVFLHNSHDDASLFTRLAMLNTFVDGDPDIIERGMNILALVMIQDHKHDMEKDREIGKYNPLDAGKWEFNALRQELVAKIAQVPCPEMETVFPLSVAMEQDWWEIH